MSNDYLEEQKQFHDFLRELDQLLAKYKVDHMYASNAEIRLLRRTDYDGWFLGSWEINKEGEHRYTRTGVIQYEFTPEQIKEPEIQRDPVVAPAIIKPLVNEPLLKCTVKIPESAIVRTDPTGTEIVSATKFKATTDETVQDDKQDNTYDKWDTAKQEKVEQEIKPEIERYINDLADRLYKEAKARNFPKNTLGEYWTHPAVVRAVKQSGFNEAAYMIISANTTYWHCLADRMKLVETLDKQSAVTGSKEEEPIEVTEQPVKIEPVVAEKIEQIESYSTDSMIGTWTVKYSDYPESVYLDSKKGRDSICSKAYNWLLIYTRMHPELSPFPTRAMLCKALADNMNNKQSFQYKWYEFVIDVVYDVPFESESENNA
jgi:hypothetical protein